MSAGLKLARTAVAGVTVVPKRESIGIINKGLVDLARDVNYETLGKHAMIVFNEPGENPSKE